MAGYGDWLNQLLSMYPAQQAADTGAVNEYAKPEYRDLLLRILQANRMAKEGNPPSQYGAAVTGAPGGQAAELFNQAPTWRT